MSQGYMPENLAATATVIHNLKYWLTLRSGPTPFTVPHNGFIETIIELPLFLASRIVFGPTWKWYDRMLSLESILFTSLMCTLIFVWARKLTGEARWGLILALTAGFTTMLWPYAYINMETTQSFSVLLSGYLALGTDRRKGLLPATAFAISCGFAVSAKASGTLFLVPAIGFLVGEYFRTEKWSKAYWYKTTMVAVVVAAMWCLGAFTRPGNFNAARSGVMFELYGVPPVRYVLNIISIFWSINKGLFVYSPILLVAIVCLPRCFREHRLLAVFALLTLGGVALGAAVLWWWSDECWGPRYLHCTVAPLLMCIAAAKDQLSATRLRKLAFATLAICGLIMSFLGAFFEYHSLHWVAVLSSPGNIEQLQYDVAWNPIWFDARLMRLWLRGRNAPVSDSDLWPPPAHYWASLPENQIQYIHPVNIREYAVPQSYLIRTWRKWQDTGDIAWWWISAISLALGSGGLAIVCYRALRLARGHPIEEQSTPIQIADQAAEPPHLPPADHLSHS
jgi:hypothetical protein